MSNKEMTPFPWLGKGSLDKLVEQAEKMKAEQIAARDELAKYGIRTNGDRVDAVDDEDADGNDLDWETEPMTAREMAHQACIEAGRYMARVLPDKWEDDEEIVRAVVDEFSEFIEDLSDNFSDNFELTLAHAEKMAPDFFAAADEALAKPVGKPYIVSIMPHDEDDAPEKPIGIEEAVARMNAITETGREITRSMVAKFHALQNFVERNSEKLRENVVAVLSELTRDESGEPIRPANTTEKEYTEMVFDRGVDARLRGISREDNPWKTEPYSTLWFEGYDFLAPVSDTGC